MALKKTLHWFDHNVSEDFTGNIQQSGLELRIISWNCYSVICQRYKGRTCGFEQVNIVKCTVKTAEYVLNQIM